MDEPSELDGWMNMHNHVHDAELLIGFLPSAPFSLSAASEVKAMSTYVWDVTQNIVEMFSPLPLQPRATNALPRGPKWL